MSEPHPDEPSGTSPEASAVAPGSDRDGVEPGEQPPSRERRRLARPPSSRFAPPAPTAATLAADRRASRRRWASATLGFAAGSLATVLLVGVGGTTTGLLFIAGASGLVIGSQLAGRQALGLAVGAVVAGDLGTWLYARWEGGVLDPPTYLATIFGLGMVGQVVVAALAAAYASERIRAAQ